MTTPPIEEAVYAHADLPRELDLQLSTFVRVVWGKEWEGDRRFRARSWDEPPPTHVVRTAGELLISHALVLPFRFNLHGEPLRVGGVGAVFTFPQFRGEGHASGVMRRAAEHIARTADAGLLFCDEAAAPFYERLGWTVLPGGRVLVRDALSDAVVMILGDARRLPDPFHLDESW